MGEKNLKKKNEELNRDKTELVNSVTELENKVTELEKEIDYYKSRESHWDEIEEDTKRIAEENAELKRYIYECWREEKSNGYSNYVTNTDSEFIELVDKLRNGS